jgi:hypothetical protein
MRDIVDRLLRTAPGAKPETFEHSDWLTDVAAEELEGVYAEYEQHFVERLAELRRLLGAPDRTDEEGGDAIARWYPEAIRAACWERGGKTLVLALEHQDRDTPVSVVLQCVTAEEMEELST